MDVAQFIEDGFVRIRRRVPARDRRRGPRHPVARHGLRSGRRVHLDPPGHPPRACTARRPFVEAANTPVLHAAFDQLVGPGRWLRRDSLGTFPVRFPSPDDPGDAGWHVDASFGDDHPDFLEWRVNVRSRGRALLMLFLFSDVGEDDAPTRIRVGSHRDDGPPARAGRRGRPVAARAGRRRLRGDGALPRGPGDGRGRHGLPVPPVPGPRRPAAPRHRGRDSWPSRRCCRRRRPASTSSTATRRSNRRSGRRWRAVVSESRDATRGGGRRRRGSSRR